MFKHHDICTFYNANTLEKFNKIMDYLSINEYARMGTIKDVSYFKARNSYGNNEIIVIHAFNNPMTHNNMYQIGTFNSFSMQYRFAGDISLTELE